MKNALKTVKKIIKENIFPLKVSSLRQDVLCSQITHIVHTHSVSIPVSTTPEHILNEYEICLNATNCLIFNIQDFMYWLYTSIVDCFGHLVSPL